MSVDVTELEAALSSAQERVAELDEALANSHKFRMEAVERVKELEGVPRAGFHAQDMTRSVATLKAESARLREVLGLVLTHSVIAEPALKNTPLWVRARAALKG